MSVEHKQAINIHIGDYLLIDMFPCRIEDRKTSKTGKHGGCKINFTGIDIFSYKKYTTIHNSGETVSVPIVTKDEYQLVSINDETPAYLTLLSNSKAIREDVQLPENELGQKLLEAFNDGKEITITIMKAMNQEAVVAYKIIDPK